LDRQQSPLFCRGESPVDEAFAEVQSSFAVEMLREHLEDSSEEAVLAPLLESSVNGGGRTVAAREIGPLSTGPQDPEHSVESGARIGPRAAGATLQFLRRDELHEVVPLMVGQVHP
jgi:hypothetical protein